MTMTTVDSKRPLGTVRSTHCRARRYIFQHYVIISNITRAVLSHGEQRDATVNFDTYRILQQHRAVSLLQHGFLVFVYMSDRSNAEI